MYFKYLKLTFVFVISALLFVGVPEQGIAQNSSDDQSQDHKPKYAPGRFIVKFKSEGPQAVDEDAQYLLERNGKFQDAVSDKSDSLDKLKGKHKVQKAKSVFVDRHGLTTADAKKKQNDIERVSKGKHQFRSQRAGKDVTAPDLSNVYVLEVPSESDIEAAVQEFQVDPHVEYAQPDYLVEAYMVPNDPYYSTYGSWGQTYDDLWGLKKIQAAQAWDVTQGEGVVVAVVDTGLDYNHPDIAANVWTNLAEIPNNLLDDDNNGKIDDVRGWDFGNNDNDPMDYAGHGTHVSGTISAVGNNNLGIIGVASKAKIMSVKGFSDSGGGLISSLADAIKYAAQNGADVINNSWGCAGSCPSNPIAEDAVRYAHGLGAVVVFAAGNSNWDVQYYSPQNMTNPKPVVVSATIQDDTPAFFTNFGIFIDVSAPGGGTTVAPPDYDPFRNILSLRAGNTGDTNLVVGSDYLRQAGTSMACPHVAGLAALILSHNPTSSNEDVRQLLRLSADDIGSPGFDTKIGKGRINAARALTIIPPKLSAQITSPANGASYLSKQTITITGTAAGADFRQYELFYNIGTEALSWVPLGPPVQTPVENNTLGFWNTLDLLDSNILLKLVVTSTSGVQFDDIASINVSNGKLKQITTNSLNQAGPSISGDLIVWHDFRNANTSSWDIYLYDLFTATERPIATAASYQLRPAISGNLIVWEDYRNDNQNGLFSNEDIYLYDLNTNTERQITTNPAGQKFPAISGNLIIWKDFRNSTYDNGWFYYRMDIYLYDLNTNTEKRITTDSAKLPLVLTHPSISGNRIVWEDERNGNYDIYLYDVSTNTERQITTNSAKQLFPAISGDLIVWADFRNGNYDIYLYDLSTNTERQITTNSATQMVPAISGNLIVWTDFRNGNPDIYSYDLSTNTERQVTGNSLIQESPVISGNNIAWHDTRNGNYDIYFYKYNHPPTLNPIGNKTINEGQMLTFTASATDSDGDALTWKLGVLPDVNADGFIDWADYNRIVALYGQVADTEEKRRADLNGSGLIEIMDVLQAINSFPFAEAYGTFNTSTGVFSWTPNFTQAGTSNVTFGVSDPDGQTASEAITINVVDTPPPDLVMSAVSTTLSSKVNWGQSIPLSDTVLNQGTGSTGSFTIAYHLSKDTTYGGADDVVLTITRTVASLAAGASSTVSSFLPVSSAVPLGTYYVCAMADSAGVINENVENNNSRCATKVIQVTAPDFVMTALSGPASGVTGGTVSFTDTAANQGSGDSLAFYVGFYLSTDATITTSDTRIGTRLININNNGLLAGATSTATTTVTIPNTLAPGTYYIGAIADYGNTGIESNETNNSRAANQITVGAGADLVMTAVSGPTTGKRGTNISVNNTVKNQGTGSAASFTVGLYFSTDATITTADTRIGTRSVSSLAAGATSAATTSVTIPSTLTPRTYYIGAIADYSNGRAESNENNNSRSGNTIIVQ